MSIQFRILESALKPKQQVFKAVGPLKVTTTAGSPNVTVATVGAGERDPISEIKAGMDISTASIAFTSTARVLSVNTGTRVVTMNTNASFAVTSVQGMFGRSYLFTVPSGVYRILASWVGGGLGGSGGFTSAGAGGGAGGASSAFHDFLLPVEPGEVLTIQLGCGGLGGAVNTAAGTNGGSGLDARSNIYTDQDADGFSYIASSNLYLPTARPTFTLALRSTAGTGTVGGRGGDGGPMYALDGGPAGGAGAAASANAAHGGHSLRRGQYGWTGGGGGGGGGPSASAPGDGGTDMLHTDGPIVAGSGLGGHGGSSAFGKGGWGGDAARGGDAKGYGAGGGGGATGFGGGNGAPGWASLSWV